LSLELPIGTPLSLFSSGFSSHVHRKAVDVSSQDMEVFRAPFSGVLLESEKVKIGRPNRYATEDYDVVSFLEVKGKRVKMLHVEPFLSPGQSFRKGDEIGVFISSPYTGGDFPHAHLEGVNIRIPRTSRAIISTKGRVINVREDYLDVEIVDFAVAGKITGLGIGEVIFNASYPFSCYGGLLGRPMRRDSSVLLYGREIGKVATKRGVNVSLFEWRSNVIRRWDYEAAFKVLVNQPICGPPFMEAVLSYGGRPLIRFFLKSDLKEGDEVDLTSFIGDGLARRGVGR